MRKARWEWTVGMLAAALALTGCGEEKPEPAGGGGAGGMSAGGAGGGIAAGGAGGSADAGPAPDPRPPHDLTEQTVEGHVTVGLGNSPAPRVRVVAHCGDDQLEVFTDDAGAFRLTANVEGCAHLVVEFQKESFLPVYRVVHLPPPTSPVTMDVVMGELRQLICGQEECIADGNRRHRLPPDPIVRGWVKAFGGTESTRILGGEYRDEEGRVLWIPAFAYYDLRDADGERIDDLGPRAFTMCISVDLRTKSQLGDVQPGQPEDPIDMPVYDLDPTTGRWRRQGMGYVGLTRGIDANANEVIEPATEAELGDIRSNIETRTAWLCGRLAGSGWLAFGLPIAEKSCLHVEVVDQCGDPLPNTVFRLQGRDYAFAAETWTDWRGEACLEAAVSEEPGEDLNHNRSGGETFWVDVSLTGRSTRRRLDAQEMPREPGSCAEPASCILIRQELRNPQASGCH